MPAHRNNKVYVGKFEVTDKKGAVSFGGSVALDILPRALMVLSIDYFDKNREGISTSFSSMEMRSFANYLYNINGMKDNYMKHLGGNNRKVEVVISKKDYMGKISICENGGGWKSIVFDLNNAYALAEEITMLINETVKTTYKIQSESKNK